MKKILVFPLVLCLILAQHITVKADNTLGYYSRTSVANYFSGSVTGSNGTVNRSDVALNYYVWNGSDPSPSFLANYVEPKISQLAAGWCLFGYFGVQGAGTVPCIIYGDSAPANFCHSSSGALYFFDNSGTIINSNYSVAYYVWDFTNSASVDNISWTSGSSIMYISSGCRVFAVEEVNVVQPSVSNTSDMCSYILGYLDTFTNYHPADLPYLLNGEIVTPEPPEVVESNENHMYFQSCELGFAEPSNVNNFNHFGGAYLYVDYDVDQWVNDHIDDYYLVVNCSATVDGETFDGQVQLSLDPDGCLCIPFSSFFDNNLLDYGMVTYTNSKLIEQNFYKTFLYSMDANKIVSWLNYIHTPISSNLLDSLIDLTVGNLGNELGVSTYITGGFTDLLKNLVANVSELPERAQSAVGYRDFKISVNCHLLDKESNVSGNVGRLFDLYTGGEIVLDSDGLTNDVPYYDDDPDYIPTIPTNSVVTNTGSGSVNVYNMTPSEIKLTIDNGLSTFINWYNTDASVGTTVDKFWSSMGIFKNNPATELYEEYWGFLPSDFKGILLGCATIGIVGGAFCILRRKIT